MPTPRVGALIKSKAHTKPGAGREHNMSQYSKYKKSKTHNADKWTWVKRQERDAARENTRSLVKPKSVC